MRKKTTSRKKRKSTPQRGKQLPLKAEPKRNAALKVAVIVLFLVFLVALLLLAHYLSMFSVKDIN